MLSAEVDIAFYSAAMAVIYYSNVICADCPPRQRSRTGSSVTLADCPPRQRSRTVHRGSGKWFFVLGCFMIRWYDSSV